MVSFNELKDQPLGLMKTLEPLRLCLLVRDESIDESTFLSLIRVRFLIDQLPETRCNRHRISHQFDQVLWAHLVIE